MFGIISKKKLFDLYVEMDIKQNKLEYSIKLLEEERDNPIIGQFYYTNSKNRILGDSFRRTDVDDKIDGYIKIRSRWFPMADVVLFSDLEDKRRKACDKITKRLQKEIDFKSLAIIDQMRVKSNKKTKALEAEVMAMYTENHARAANGEAPAYSEGCFQKKLRNVGRKPKK